MTRLLAPELDAVLSQTSGLWEELRGRRVFITGGTGFFGCWLLETLTWAHERLGLGVSAVVLTRDPAAFQSKAPHLAGHPAVRLHRGDVRGGDFPAGEFSHVIHAATEASVPLNGERPLEMLDTVVLGTRQALDFACRSGARKFLLVSSGAVYGPQPPGMTHVNEEYRGAPDPLDPHAAYAHGKRMAEHLCALYARTHGLEPAIARCFAFVGPYQNLDIHFAIGNFIRDALRGGPIQVRGDGTPYRSYLYAADLAVWLWTILLHGAPCRPYNVGGAEALTVGDLAAQVAGQFTPRPEVQIARAPAPGQPPARYVPDVNRARNELGLRATVGLDEAIRRTAAWHRASRPA